jgi:hypothetical protein
MINLNTSSRDLKRISEDFYNRIENSIAKRISDRQSELNNFRTDASRTPLGDYLNSNIKKLIISPLESLNSIFDGELSTLCRNEYTRTQKIDSDFKNLLNFILFYESQDIWKAYQLAIDIGTNTCPYCNRNYITTLGTDDKKFVRGDFDHFLPKSKFPYLRLSFYNLIPCCITCNRNAKKAEETSLDNNIYPYKEGFNNETLFTYIPQNYNDLIGKGKPKIDFLYLGSPDHIEKSKRNVKLFRLHDQYSIHIQELNDIINKRRVFSNSYLIELKNNYPKLLTFEEAYLLAFGKEFDLAKHEKRPLSKFTKDITEELGLIPIQLSKNS